MPLGVLDSPRQHMEVRMSESSSREGAPLRPPPPPPGDEKSVISLSKALGLDIGKEALTFSAKPANDSRYFRFVSFLTGQGRPVPEWLQPQRLSEHLGEARESQKKLKKKRHSEDSRDEEHFLPITPALCSGRATSVYFPLERKSTQKFRVPFREAPAAKKEKGRSRQSIPIKEQEACLCTVQVGLLDLRLHPSVLERVDTLTRKRVKMKRDEMAAKRCNLLRTRMQPQQQQEEQQGLAAPKHAGEASFSKPLKDALLPRFLMKTEAQGEGGWLLEASVKITPIDGPPRAPEQAAAELLRGCPAPQETAACKAKVSPDQLKLALKGVAEAKVAQEQKELELKTLAEAKAALDKVKKEPKVPANGRTPKKNELSGEQNSGKGKKDGEKEGHSHSAQGVHWLASKDFEEGCDSDSDSRIDDLLMRLPVSSLPYFRIYLVLSCSRKHIPKALGLSIHLSFSCRPACDLEGEAIFVASGVACVSRALFSGLIQLSAFQNQPKTTSKETPPNSFAGVAHVQILCGGLRFVEKPPEKKHRENKNAYMEAFIFDEAKEHVDKDKEHINQDREHIYKDKEHVNVKNHVTKDEEHVKKDEEHVKKYEEHVKKDEEHDMKDKERAKKDKERAKKDKERAKKDKERAKKDKERAKKDKEHVMKDNEHFKKDREHVKKDKEHVKEDKEHVKEDKEHVKEDKEHVVKNNEHVMKDKEHVMKGRDHGGKEEMQAIKGERPTNPTIRIERALSGPRRSSSITLAYAERMHELRAAGKAPKQQAPDGLKGVPFSLARQASAPLRLFLEPHGTPKGDKEASPDAALHKRFSSPECLETSKWEQPRQPAPAKVPRNLRQGTFNVVVHLRPHLQKASKQQQQGKANGAQTTFTLGERPLHLQQETGELLQLERLLAQLQQENSRLALEGLVWARAPGRWPASLGELRSVMALLRSLKSSGQCSVHVVSLNCPVSGAAGAAAAASGVYVLQSILKSELIDPFAYMRALLEFCHVSSQSGEGGPKEGEATESSWTLIDSPLVVGLHAIYHDPVCVHIIREWLPPPAAKLADVLPPKGNCFFNEAGARRLLQQVLQLLQLLQAQREKETIRPFLTPETIYLRGDGGVALALPRVSRFCKQQGAGAPSAALLYKPSFQYPLRDSCVRRSLPGASSLRVCTGGATRNEGPAACLPLAYLAPEELESRLSSQTGSTAATSAQASVKREPGDVWRVGVLGFHLLTGGVPFAASSPEALKALLARKGLVGELLLRCLPLTSLSCRDFLAGVLLVDPQSRFTVQQAANHAWIASAKSESGP